jgi:hypothetical protein
VWPRYVATVRKINVCGASVVVKNSWYDFLPYTDSPWGKQNWNSNAFAGNWWGNNAWGGYCGPAVTMVDQGKSPVFQDVLGEGRYVRVYAQARLDVGKTVTIFGIDNNGQPLRTRNSDDTYSDGWIITIGDPFGSTTDYVRSIERVLLDDMTNTVRLFGYNPATDLLEDIGTYEPGDTNPAFERYKLNLPPNTNGQCGCSKSVIALVKLKFVPARYDNDLVLIENLDALSMMIQSVKRERAEDYEGKRQFEADAIRELNLQLNDASPVEEIPIANPSFSGARIGYQRMF